MNPFKFLGVWLELCYLSSTGSYWYGSTGPINIKLEGAFCLDKPDRWFGYISLENNLEDSDVTVYANGPNKETLLENLAQAVRNRIEHNPRFSHCKNLLEL